MANSSLTPLYFPYIYQLLNSVDDTDMRLYPIMECLVCVLPVMGMESQPYILTIYKRYLQLLGKLPCRRMNGSCTYHLDCILEHIYTSSIVRGLLTRVFVSITRH